MDCSSILVVGVRLADVYVERKVTEERTKYDPDTGTPYQVKMDVIKRTFLNQPLPDLIPQKVKWYCEDEYRRDWDFFPAGLSLVCPHSDLSEDDLLRYSLLGVRVGKPAEEGEWHREINLAAVEDARQRVYAAIFGAALLGDEKPAIRVFHMVRV